nr:hypothetical protein [Streptococcus anginosus]
TAFTEQELTLLGDLPRRHFLWTLTIGAIPTKMLMVPRNFSFRFGSTATNRVRVFHVRLEVIKKSKSPARVAE